MTSTSPADNDLWVMLYTISIARRQYRCPFRRLLVHIEKASSPCNSLCMYPREAIYAIPYYHWQPKWCCKRMIHDEIQLYWQRRKQGIFITYLSMPSLHRAGRSLHHWPSPGEPLLISRMSQVSDPSIRSYPVFQAATATSPSDRNAEGLRWSLRRRTGTLAFRPWNAGGHRSARSNRSRLDTRAHHLYRKCLLILRHRVATPGRAESRSHERVD